MGIKTRLIGAVLGFGFSAGLAWAEGAHGTWQTEPGDTGGYLHVEISSCGAALCGTIAKAFDANGAVSGDYAHIGKPMIWDMAAAGGDAYRGGKIWAPDKDKTYRSKMSLKGDQLTVKGCVAGGAICRGQTWQRVK